MEKAKKFIDTCSEAMTLTDINHNIIHVNQKLCKITGYDREELIGNNLKILQYNKTDLSLIETLRQNLRENKNFGGQAWNRRKDGTEFLMQWTIFKLYLEEQYYIAIQQDITSISSDLDRINHNLAILKLLTRNTEYLLSK
jgi:PAS domain S-box-containing protein